VASSARCGRDRRDPKASEASEDRAVSKESPGREATADTREDDVRCVLARTV
jgi:hypothetical protein